jgi:hypothetical protein
MTSGVPLLSKTAALKVLGSEVAIFLYLFSCSCFWFFYCDWGGEVFRPLSAVVFFDLTRFSLGFCADVNGGALPREAEEG